MNSISLKTFAALWVIFITLTSPLSSLFFINKGWEVTRLQAQLRSQPTNLPIASLFDSNDPPSWVQFQNALNEVVSEYQSEIGLNIMAQMPYPLEVEDIQNLQEIRARAEAKYPWTIGMTILFFSDSSGPTKIETVTEKCGNFVKEIKIRKTVFGAHLEPTATIAIYDCHILFSIRTSGGKNQAVAVLKHEIGHHIGLSHNPSIESFMNESCDKTLDQWTVTDLYVILARRKLLLATALAHGGSFFDQIYQSMHTKRYEITLELPQKLSQIVSWCTSISNYQSSFFFT